MQNMIEDQLAFDKEILLAGYFEDDYDTEWGAVGSWRWRTSSKFKIWRLRRWKWTSYGLNGLNELKNGLTDLQNGLK